jgi:hypothetical protein
LFYTEPKRSARRHLSDPQLQHIRLKKQTSLGFSPPQDVLIVKQNQDILFESCHHPWKIKRMHDMRVNTGTALRMGVNYTAKM